MVVFNLYPRLARTQIGESLKKMNSFRSAALLDGKAAPHSTAEYRSLVATAASLTSALTTPQNILFHLERLSAFSEAALKDPKYDPRTLSKYDTRQDRWWYGGEKAEREFIDSLRIVALHVLHGEASSPEDFFHIFQMLKCLRESDPKERNIPDFLMPAYGGILLPDSFEGTTRNGLLGRLLLYLTEINSLVPLDAEGLILNLNWFPEDGEEGLKEMQLVLDAAELLGY
ncbi:hypothetical protein KJ780_01450 [Candidatus Micrarchaeota archaeon]|nr:hypothetical protein [Candidatus Micrarchaeota archaeon]